MLAAEQSKPTINKKATPGGVGQQAGALVLWQQPECVRASLTSHLHVPQSAGCNSGPTPITGN